MKNFKLGFEAIGTKWVIDCYDSKVSEEEVLAFVKSRIEVFDRIYSRFRKDSLVWQISEKAGEYSFPPDSKDLFAHYEQLYKITDGKFTLLVGNLLDEAGYDASYSLKPRKIHKVPEVSFIYSFEYPTLTVKKPYILDFGGLGKGYLINIIADLLTENGVNSFCINGGGDIFCKNLKEPMRVGLENPMDMKQVIGVIEVNNKSICASAGNKRTWDKFSHIMDPDILNSSQRILASWVIAKNAFISDALATCLFLVSPQKLSKYFDFEYLILNPDFSINKSENFNAEFFYKESVK